MSSFYRWFVKGFSTIAAPLYEVIGNNKPFKWSDEQAKAFQTVKSMLSSSRLLQLFDLEKMLEVEYDTSKVGIGAILMQDRKLIAYFSEKL